MKKILFLSMVLFACGNKTLFSWTEDGTPENFHEAAWCGDKQFFQAILNDITPAMMKKECEGKTPLAFAIAGGHKDIVSLLKQFFTEDELVVALCKYSPRSVADPIGSAHDVRCQERSCAGLVAPSRAQLFSNHFAEEDTP